MGLHVFYVTALVILTANLANALLFGSEGCEHCGDNTVCLLGKCVCRFGYVGDPYFYCYRSQQYYCGIRNDPVLQTFGGEHVKLYNIGSTRFARFQTKKYEHRRLKEICDFDISIFTGRHKGKIYVAGAQAKVIRTRHKNNQISEVTVRVIGKFVTGTNDTYRWTVEAIEEGQTNFSSLGIITSDQPIDTARRSIRLGRYCDIQVYRDREQFLRVEFTCCGVSFGIRPYNPVTRTIIPGIWLVIDRLTYRPFFPNWPWNGLPICLAPSRIRIKDVVREIGIPNAPCAVSFLSYTNGGVTEFPQSTTAVQQIGATLATCSVPQRTALYVWDKFIIVLPPFIRCYSRYVSGPYGAVDLFLDAVRYLCGGDSSRCTYLKNVINGRCHGLIAGHPDVQAFLDQPCM